MEADGKVVPLERPYDREHNPSIYSRWSSEQIVNLEENGGTFEKLCYFQYNHAWMIRFDMAIPFKRLIWANRLNERSYNQHMARLGLRPAQWTTTQDLKREWNESDKMWRGNFDPAFRKANIPRNIELIEVSPITTIDMIVASQIPSPSSETDSAPTPNSSADISQVQISPASSQSSVEQHPQPSPEPNVTMSWPQAEKMMRPERSPNNSPPRRGSMEESRRSCHTKL